MFMAEYGRDDAGSSRAHLKEQAARSCSSKSVSCNLLALLHVLYMSFWTNRERTMLDNSNASAGRSGLSAPPDDVKKKRSSALWVFLILAVAVAGYIFWHSTRGTQAAGPAQGGPGGAQGAQGGGPGRGPGGGRGGPGGPV